MNRKHRLIWWLLRPLVRIFLYFKLGYRAKVAKNLPEKYIVLANHNTDWDPVLVGVSFKKQMYFVGSEHISRWGFAYKLLRWVFDPIMRPKGTSAASAILEILRRVRCGANVCMFAEGVRSWDGRPSPIADTTGQLVKSAKCALVTYRLVGGFFASPGWSGSGMRRGYLRGAPVAVYTAEELAAMSVDEINAIIRRDLYEDAYDRQEAEPHRYRGRALAEGLELLAPDCPVCSARDAMRAEGNRYFCSACGAAAIYTEYGMLEGIEGIKNVRELSDRQRKRISEEARTGVRYTAEMVSLYRVERHIVELICEGTMTLRGDVFTVGDVTFSVPEMDDLAIHGRYALVFSVGKDYYEITLTPGVSTGINKFIHYYRERRTLTKKS